MIGIYIHIPYCKTLCPYCDFVKVRTRDGAPDAFVNALCAEIAEFDGPDVAGSIFFGGGTPSQLSAAQLARVLDTLRERFTLDAPEITLEANPDDVTVDLARAWRAAGVNRVSLGVQSLDDRVLRYLGRRHDAASARRACAVVAETFDNWSFDLIFGAPPVDAWEATLSGAVAMDPPHVAAYGLTYEEGTPFERRAGEAVDDEVSLAMYRSLEGALGNYHHYEISNFAKPGRESKHNLIYWRNGEYAGFGTGAYSYLGGVRARNETNTDAYLRAPGTKCEALTLSDAEVRIETVIQYMRLRTGLPRAEYAARFGHDVREDFGPALDAMIARGLVTEDLDTFLPTREGFYLNNEIGLALVEAGAAE